MISRCRHLLLTVLVCVGPASAQEGVTAWVNELLRNKDDAAPELITKIAASRSREGAEGLAQAYASMGSLLMRREILRGLAQWAQVADGEQVAMQKLADIAGMDEDEGLRTEAMAALARSPVLGKSLLRKLVDSEGPDSVREPALAEHAKLATADDADWYRHLWNLKQEQRKDSKGEIAAPELPSIRLLAFRALRPYLSEDDLVDALKREINPKIRREALAWMAQQSMPKAAEMAEWVLERVDFPGADRSEAARIYAERAGTKAVGKFLDLMKKRDVTPEDLRVTMADLIVGMRDDATNKRLGKMLGKGKPHEKVFLIRATEGLDDPKAVAAIRKQLGDEALEVRRAAAEALGKRRDRESLETLRAMLAKAPPPEDVRLVLTAITAIDGTTSAWLKELAGYATHADREVRNVAIEVIGRARDKRQLDVVLAALDHEDWSTRFAAIDAAASMRQKQGVAKLIERIGKETGRMRRCIADVLWQLTAQPFGEDVDAWQGWWAEAGPKFEVVTERDVDKAERERERKRLVARTTAAPSAKFFGIKVESHRVIFVLDISGSMLESMYGRFVGKRGAARIDIAKMELAQAIENLEEGTLFNILAFASSVTPWRKEGIAVFDANTKADALEWLGRLGANGATNLYDTVKMAFTDPDVDTIFIMSDGEPTNGEVIDPFRIREDVAFWNQHRKIKINTIAIGGNLEVLEWLAKDSGGTYLQMR